MATFYNKATLTYNNGSTDSNIVSGELTEVLSATKTALDAEYNSGCPNTYFISIVNSGNIAFSGLTVTDDLGQYTSETAGALTPLDYVPGSAKYFINGSLQGTPSVNPASPLTFTGINVPANGNALIIYKAYANKYAPLGSGAEITNTATVSGSTLSSDVTASATVGFADDPGLSITKTLFPETVTEDSQITYTFIIQNRGGTAVVAGDNATVTDTFNPVLSNLSVTLDGKPLAATTGYTYNTATGEFATVPGQITVPAATFSSDNETGVWTATPGVAVLKVTGTI